MKHNKPQFNIVAGVVSLVIALTVSLLPLATVVARQQTAGISPEREKQLIAAFNRHVRDYLKQRGRVKAKLPPLSKDATPEQITAYQKSFVDALRAMRAGTKPGYIFNKESADYLRTIVKTEFAPREKAEIRETRATFPFDFVLLLGDNLYGGESPKDYKNKFENVYRSLLDQNVKFYATLGNHDEPAQRFYEYFNMNGNEYYRFTKGNVAFYSLNSNYMDRKQVKWLEDELTKDTSEWKITFHHHPPYSSGGKHGSDTALRKVVEPIFLKYGVNLVLTGHDHFYERMKPQKGIYYFVSGAGGKLREGDSQRHFAADRKILRS